MKTKAQKIPEFKTIDEMAAFWQKHSPLDFDVVEVTEPVFVRKNVIEVPLQPQEMEAVEKIASSMGMDNAELIRQWVLEKLPLAG
jgi:hypothetical protein